MKKLFLTAIAALFLATSMTPAASASFVVRDGDVYLSNTIERGDDRIFKAAIDDDTSVKRVVLNSDGGNMEIAIAIADRIRTRGLSTYVADNSCASACVLIWAAGKPRRLSEGARLGLHCALLKPFNECDERATKEAADYLREVRAPERLIKLLASTGPFMVWVVPEDLQEEATK